MHFTFIDIIFAIIVLVFAIMACTNGFIKELFGKVSVILGIFVASFFCGALKPYMAKIINNSAVSLVVSFLLLFIVTFLFVKIIQYMVGNFLSGEILQSLDRVLGFFFGLFEGLIVVCCVFIIIQAQPWFEGLKEFFSNGFFWSILGKLLDKPISYVKGVLV